MGLSIATQTGLPRTWEIAGEEFKVSGITYYQLAVLSDHLRSVIQHPIDEARERIALLGDLITAEDRREIILEADRAARPENGQWPPSFESFAGQRYYYQSPEGVAFFLHTILVKHQPDLSIEEVKRRIAPKVSIKDMEALNLLIEVVDEDAVRKRKRRLAELEEGLEPEEEAPVVLHTEMGVGGDQDPKASSSPSES